MQPHQMGGFDVAPDLLWMTGASASRMDGGFERAGETPFTSSTPLWWVVEWRPISSNYRLFADRAVCVRSAR
jgi:hypothetical protein